MTLHDLPAPALAGAIQYRNAATAIAAMQSLGGGRGARGAAVALARRLGPLDAPLVSGALAQVRLAGRFQIVPGAVEWILDIAHNEPAAQVLAAQLAARPPPGGAGARTFAVIGVLADKDAPAIGAALAPVIDRWIMCALPGAARQQRRRSWRNAWRARPRRCSSPPPLPRGARWRRRRPRAGRSRRGVWLGLHRGPGARVASDILMRAPAVPRGTRPLPRLAFAFSPSF